MSHTININLTPRLLALMSSEAGLVKVAHQTGSNLTKERCIAGARRIRAELEQEMPWLTITKPFLIRSK